MAIAETVLPSLLLPQRRVEENDHSSGPSCHSTLRRMEGETRAIADTVLPSLLISRWRGDQDDHSPI